MALSVDWPNKIINVLRADMLLVQSLPIEIRELNIDAFRLELKSLEADPEGISYVDTHKHNTIVTLGGVTYARLVEIINDYTVTFEDGQYAVNLVGANSNIGDVVNVNQVSVRSANSAGLTYSKEIEDLSFTQARIWIDTDEGTAQTQYPAGTPAFPVSSYDVAHSILDIRGLPHRFELIGYQILELHDEPSEGDRSSWVGRSPRAATIDFQGINTLHYNMEKLTLTGQLVGDITARDCTLMDLTDFEGAFHDCGIDGTLTLLAGAGFEVISFHNCFSMTPGTGSPTLDCNNATHLNIQFRQYDGGIRIMNYSSVDNNMTIDLQAGHVIIDATCTDGTIVIRGSGHITDESSGGVTLVHKGLNYAHGDKLLEEKRWIALH